MLERKATHPGLFGKHKMDSLGAGKEREQELVWVAKQEQLWKEFGHCEYSQSSFYKILKDPKKDNL